MLDQIQSSAVQQNVGIQSGHLPRQVARKTAQKYVLCGGEHDNAARLLDIAQQNKRFGDQRIFENRLDGDKWWLKGQANTSAI